ncbi:MAG: hypothetical protein AAFZ80_07535 [Cyanobacteria bacterium P01_A01_bin.105]
MSLQKLPIATLQKVQGYVRQSLALPEQEDRPRRELLPDGTDDIPEPSSLDGLGDLFRIGSTPDESVSTPNLEGRWFVSTVDVGRALVRLPIQLKPGLRLVTYLCRTAETGEGSIWVIPEHLSATAHLESALSSSTNMDEPPYPEGALLKIMSGMTGDRSALSFVTASIVGRELSEFGRRGNRCDWSHHRFIATVPKQRDWKWRMTPPTDLQPKVRLLPDGQAAVEFYTCRIVAPIGIYRHVDQYPVNGYLPKSMDQPVATVPTPVAVG